MLEEAQVGNSLPCRLHLSIEWKVPLDFEVEELLFVLATDHFDECGEAFYD